MNYCALLLYYSLETPPLPFTFTFTFIIIINFNVQALCMMYYCTRQYYQLWHPPPAPAPARF